MSEPNWIVAERKIAKMICREFQVEYEKGVCGRAWRGQDGGDMIIPDELYAKGFCFMPEVKAQKQWGTPDLFRWIIQAQQNAIHENEKKSRIKKGEFFFWVLVLWKSMKDSPCIIQRTRCLQFDADADYQLSYFSERDLLDRELSKRHRRKWSTKALWDKIIVAQTSLPEKYRYDYCIAIEDFSIPDCKLLNFATFLKLLKSAAEPKAL